VITDTVSVTDALYSLDKVSNWSVRNDTEIHWSESNEASQPTDAEITAEINRLQAIYDAQEYARKRKAKYDALNQFELISDDAINGTTTHKDAIVAIKSEFPKP